MASRKVRRRQKKNKSRRRTRRSSRRVLRGGADGFNDRRTVVVARTDDIDSVGTLQSERTYSDTFGPDTPA